MTIKKRRGNPIPLDRHFLNMSIRSGFMVSKSTIMWRPIVGMEVNIEVDTP